MERRFPFLARSYGFTEQLTDFSNETKRQADRLPTSRASCSALACSLRCNYSAPPLAPRVTFPETASPAYPTTRRRNRLPDCIVSPALHLVLTPDI
jgi:hypothetical protein